MPEISFSDGIKQATQHLLETDDKVVVIGLGANYDKGLDGTIGDIHKRFPKRVLDTPLSEAGNGGACVGMAINGLKPIFHNGRTEFALFAIDSIVTQASKWSYMFGGEAGSVPITFRIAVGRAWGSGPQHSQALYPLWANCAGLKVVVPSTPQMARDLLYSAALDPNPVAYVEPRWLYNIKEDVATEISEIPLDKARIIAPGSNITVATYGDGVYEALLARNILHEYGISLEIIDLVSINPIDYDTVINSVKKTGALVALDISNYPCSVGGEVITGVLQELVNNGYPLRFVKRIACDHVPIPAATSLVEEYYPNRFKIINKILDFYNIANIEDTSTFSESHLAPSTNITKLCQ